MNADPSELRDPRTDGSLMGVLKDLGQKTARHKSKRKEKKEKKTRGQGAKMKNSRYGQIRSMALHVELMNNHSH